MPVGQCRQQQPAVQLQGGCVGGLRPGRGNLGNEARRHCHVEAARTTGQAAIAKDVRAVRHQSIKATRLAANTG